MSRLTWGSAPDRIYEVGIDRGVLYLDDEFAGVPWNGLIAVRELPTGGEVTPYYVDGFKYANVSSAEEYAATIEAFTSPSEFDACDGSRQPYPGLTVTQQKRTKFGFSYRTLIGDASVGENKGYKIHLVYNATAGPSQKDRQTIGAENTPLVNSWPVTTQPIIFPGIRPTSHFVIDSTKTNSIVLAFIEAYIYGADNIFASLPMSGTLVGIFEWQPSINPTHPIIHNGIRYDGDFLSIPGTLGEMWNYDGDIWVYTDGAWQNVGEDPIF